jgi:hypothetical protein
LNVLKIGVYGDVSYGLDLIMSIRHNHKHENLRNMRVFVVV